MTMPAFPPITDLDDLRPLNVTPDIGGGGQSLGVWRVPGHPGLLFKWYNPEGIKNTDPHVLDRLIAEPGRLTDPADRDLLQRWTSWPVSRVKSGTGTVGVIIREAPVTMDVRWLAARGTIWKVGPIEVDFLAKDNDFLSKRKIPEQSPDARAEICTHLVRIAALLDSRDIVYADWSYANAFWHPSDHTVFLIDMDGCSFGPRAHVFTPNFEDPGTPPPVPVDKYTDRYRVALLCARMLTGRREIDEVMSELKRVPGEPARLLRRAIDTTTGRGQRPSLAALQAAFAPGAPVRPEVPAPRPPTGGVARPERGVSVMPERGAGVGGVRGRPNGSITVRTSAESGVTSVRPRPGSSRSSVGADSSYVPTPTYTAPVDESGDPDGRITFGGVVAVIFLLATFIALCIYVL